MVIMKFIGRAVRGCRYQGSQLVITPAAIPQFRLRKCTTSGLMDAPTAVLYAIPANLLIAEYLEAGHARGLFTHLFVTLQGKCYQL